MRLVSIIKRSKHSVFIFLILGSLCTSAQQNSPFSRFGLGDVLPSTNILNRAMGGVSVPYVDGQSINFANPASYSRLNLVTFDLGLTIDNRDLKSLNPVKKYNSINFIPSYVMLGLPISSKKQIKNNRNVAMVFGLRPVSTINYSIIEGRKLQITNADSVVYLYEGTGGLNQAFIGLSKRYGSLSVGINAGYIFGRKETDTKTFILDTVATPSYRSSSATITSFGSGFINAGVMYEALINKTTSLRFGASGNLSQSLNAEQELKRQTFVFDGVGNPLVLDTITNQSKIKGTVELPSSFTAGVMLNKKTADKNGSTVDSRMIGIEYTTTNWADYRFYNQNENLRNSWQFKIGGQFIPKPFNTGYWNRVAYRAGFNIGKDQIVAQGNDYSTYSLSIGAGFPVQRYRAYDNQYTTINTALEIGKRGNKSNNITESFVRFSLGLNLSDIWFIKRKYD